MFKLLIVNCITNAVLSFYNHEISTFFAYLYHKKGKYFRIYLIQIRYRYYFHIENNIKNKKFT